MPTMRLLAIAALFALAACARDGRMADGSSATTNFGASLTSANEVPPVASPGHGDAQVTFDKSTRQLRWNVSYANLTGPATAAHFHGPAGPGTNAGVAVNLSPGGPPQNPITGSTVLTEAQAQQLLAGQWYVNVHTQRNPGGEIRGQVMPR